MIQIVALGILLQEAEAHAIRVLHLINDVIRLGKIDLILVPDDLALRLGFQTHFDNIPRLVVEEAMGVP